jgi:hypothetical protein
MIKVYEPIKDSADAAKTSADAARRTVDVSEDGVRAWIAPTNFSFVDLNNANDPLRVRVSYQNVGREPAIKVKNRSPSAIITNVTEQWGTLSNWHEEMFKPENICVDMNKTDVTSVVYPTTNVSAEIYIPTFDKMDRSTLLTRVKEQRAIYIVMGCFTYETLKNEKYSAFCGVLMPDTNKDISNWHFGPCPAGNEAK